MSTVKRPALGRGLDALIPNRPAAPAGTTEQGSAFAHGAAPVAATVSDGKPLEIPVERIDPSPYQPRFVKREEGLEELARSIGATGVIQPIIVRPVQGRFELIAGERRWRASQLAGKSTVPAIVRHVSNEQAMEMALVENLQRTDLNPMDQARAFQRLSSEFGLTQEQMALRTGKDRATVANLMRLNKLCADGQAFIQSGKISFGHGRALATIEDEKLQFELVHKIVKQELNVRETELLVASYLAPGLMKREPEKPAAEVDPNVKDAIEQLQRILGLKVQIKDRKGRGRVIIDYANLDDFDRLLTQLLK